MQVSSNSNSTTVLHMALRYLKLDLQKGYSKLFYHKNPYSSHYSQFWTTNLQLMNFKRCFQPIKITFYSKCHAEHVSLILIWDQIWGEHCLRKWEAHVYWFIFHCRSFKEPRTCATSYCAIQSMLGFIGLLETKQSFEAYGF